MKKILLGQKNTLKAMWRVDFGMYLEGNEEGKILLPERYVPEDLEIGDEIEVFVYLDNEERLVATTLEPKAMVGDFAYLEVAWVNEYGAFLNWGLMKDLFCPFREQKVRMQRGQRYQVYCYIDDLTYRIVCSSKIDKFMQGRENVNLFSEHLLEYIKQQPDGYCRFHDKSPAEDIYAEFGVSKKVFKQAVGELYKKQLIVIEESGLSVKK